MLNKFRQSDICRYYNTEFSRKARARVCVSACAKAGDSYAEKYLFHRGNDLANR
jgi:hypothetical protein